MNKFIRVVEQSSEMGEDLVATLEYVESLEKRIAALENRLRDDSK